MATEAEILVELLSEIQQTFEHPTQKDLRFHPDADKFIQEDFLPKVLQGIFQSSPNQGISFPILKNLFSYFYTKSVDAVLIAENENALLLGVNYLHKHDDIPQGKCSISRYFLKYDTDPNDEYAIGEEYFYAFQKVCVNNQLVLENSKPLLIIKILAGALLAILPYAIDRGCEIYSK